MEDIPPSDVEVVPLAYSPKPTRHNMLRAFSHRNYRLFFGGQLVSLIGTFLTQVATLWLVYHQVPKPWILGVVAFAGQIPMFLLAPFAGVWVDRLNRRRLLVLTQFLSMLQSFGLAAVALWVHGEWTIVWGVSLLAVAQGLINAFDMPGRQAFLIEMVEDPDDLANAIALNSTMVHSARLIGPALGGLLIHLVGASLCFFLDGTSYIAVILSLLAMRIKARQRRTGRSVFSELHEGFSYVWHFSPIRTILILMALLSLTAMPAISTLMPVYAEAFGGRTHSDEFLGLLMSATGVGALIGALYLASRRSVVGLGRVIAYAGIAFGLALLGFSFAHSMAVALPFAAISGCAMLMNFASCNTLLQTLTDEDKRGRVMSFFVMSFIGMTPFGSLLAGFMASWFSFNHAQPVVGASRTLIVEGSLAVITALLFASRLPALRKIVRPIYVLKGILPQEAASGIQSAEEVVTLDLQQ